MNFTPKSLATHIDMRLKNFKISELVNFCIIWQRTLWIFKYLFEHFPLCLYRNVIYKM